MHLHPRKVAPFAFLHHTPVYIPSPPTIRESNHMILLFHFPKLRSQSRGPLRIDHLLQLPPPLLERPHRPLTIQPRLHRQPPILGVAGRDNISASPSRNPDNLDPEARTRIQLGRFDDEHLRDVFIGGSIQSCGCGVRIVESGEHGGEDLTDLWSGLWLSLGVALCDPEFWIIGIVGELRGAVILGGFLPSDCAIVG